MRTPHSNIFMSKGASRGGDSICMRKMWLSFTGLFISQQALTPSPSPIRMGKARYAFRRGSQALLGSLLLVSLLSGCRWGAMGQNTVGVQLHQQGRYAEALQQFEAARVSDPANPDSFYNLASTYHKMGVSQRDPKLIEQAEALYNQCLDMSPNHADCYRGLSVLLVESNRSDKAFTLLKRWSTSNPQSSDAKIELAKLHQEFNQLPPAEQLLDEVLAKDPNNAVAWTARGRLRETTGDLAQARQNYLQSLSLNAVQPEAAQRLASVDMRLGQQAWQRTVAATQSTVATAQNSLQSTMASTQNSLQSTVNATQNTLSAAQAAIANSGPPASTAPPSLAAPKPPANSAPLPSPRY
jgi:tetratricopeptide (TPR) repeat protein